MYKTGSFCDKGTLKQLANLINQTNIPKTVKNDFTAAQNFFGLVLDAHIIAAAMQFIGVKNE